MEQRAGPAQGHFHCRPVRRRVGLTLLVGVLPTQAAVLEDDIVAVDVVAKAEAAKPQAPLTTASGTSTSFLMS